MKKTKLSPVEEISMWIGFHIGEGWRPLSPKETNDFIRFFGNPEITITQTFIQEGATCTVEFIQET